MTLSGNSECLSELTVVRAFAIASIDIRLISIDAIGYLRTKTHNILNIYVIKRNLVVGVSYIDILLLSY